jgi:hypothetical protein
MTSHRTRFLASLSERLESDLASRELDGDESRPPPRIELTDRPGGGHEPSPEDSAGDQIAGAPAAGAARIEPEQDSGWEAGAPPQHRRPPGEMIASIGALVESEGERTQVLSTPWSETGMPLRLREAIASVRRVSHEMHEPSHDDEPMREPAPLTDGGGYDDGGGDDDYGWAHDAAYEEPRSDGHRARLEDDAAPEGGQIGADGDAAYEERPPDDELVLLDEVAGFEREQMPLENDAYQEPAAEDELVPLGDSAVREEDQTGFGQWADAEPPPDDHALALDEEAAYRHGQTRLGDAPFAPAPGDQAGHAHRWLEDDPEDQASAPGSMGPTERRPLWRGVTTRYRVHAAAFAIAIAFVALAGFGLGILSGGGDREGPLARDTLRTAPTQPGPPSGQNALRAAPEQPAELNELVTVRVAPAPIAGVPEPAAAAGVSTRALPLPPPPKPVLRQSATAEAPSTDRQLAGAVDDAAAALLEAEGAAEGTGGPFEPLFAKLPAQGATQARVFVHYSASGVGAPATAMHLVRQLKAEGFAVEARAVEFPIPTNSIRYFFDADREQAEALRSSLAGQIPGGGALTVMDFTTYEPRPRPGLLEVWLRA